MNAVIGTFDIKSATVLSDQHPPVLKTVQALADQGTLAMGLLLAKDGDGKAVPYEPAGLAPLNVCIGVLTQEIDTTADTEATVLRHGTGVRELLLVGATAPDAAALAVLEDLGIFAV